MKKILSFVLVAGIATSAFSQSLWTDNFESYNVGNLGTQGGWGRDGGGASSFTKVANIDAAHGKSFQLASNATNDGVWEYHDTNWLSKSDDNNTLVVEYDYYTGVAGSGVGIVQMYDVDAGYEMPFELGWDPTAGYMYVANENDGVIIDENPTANTWYHIKASYDMFTGQVKVQLNNTGEVFEFDSIPGLQPTEFDVLLYSVTTAGFDNIKVSAVNGDPFLAVTDISNVKTKVSVYPNPATDVINVKSDNKISLISLFDISGKLVKTTAESTMNVQDLAKGSYVVSVKYADGTTETKKVVKK
ncbi:T9SS type A sorting domain-containing protein [Kaistella sp.]|uniref:T9SS type A sorting domain-containing protein n=1 Tax=Kaistella sp. TaxID=2782235 RepID=UPI003C50456D